MGEVVYPIMFRRVCPSCKQKILWTDDPAGYRVGECDCRIIVVVTEAMMLNADRTLDRIT